MSSYLIVGAGISGCTAAETLANQGHQVTLLETQSVIGGAVREYACKATDQCSRCGVCVAHTHLQAARTHQNTRILTGAAIQTVSNNGALAINVHRKHPTIDYQQCQFCDACVQQCPQQCITKIHRAELIQYAIDYDACLLHQGQTCTVCADACAAGAIDASVATTDTTVSGDAVLVATGHEPYNARQHVRFGYGRIPNVMTGVEAEEILGRQTYLRSPSDSVAFIQCVGSRDPRLGRNYCSSVCCAYAMRLSRMIKYRHPDTPVTIYYIDLQNFDKTFTQFKHDVEANGVRFVRGLPFSVETVTQTGRVRLRFEDPDDGESLVQHDLVVLSVGMGPTANAVRMAELFELQRDTFGFLSSSAPNIFVSGTCQEPLSIPDSMAAARAIALEMDSLSDTSTVSSVSVPSSEFETKQIPLEQGVLVLGGGVAGLTVASELQHRGYTATLVEQAQELGGQIFPDIHDETCKHTRWQPDQAYSAEINVLTGSTLRELQGHVGNFSACVQMPDGERTIPCGAVVVATGTSMPDIAGPSPHIVTLPDIHLALESLTTQRGIRTIGIVLDHSHDESKASTEMALKLALHIQQMTRYQVLLFCRDMRVAAKPLEQLYDDARESGVAIVKYEGTLTFHDAEHDVTVDYTDALMHESLTVSCDRVALSPFGETSVDPVLVNRLSLSTDAYGQLQENNIHLFPEQTNRPGMFVVGACRGQAYLPQVITEAKATAQAVHALLSQKTLEVELSNAVVDPDKCALCLTCIRSCPYQAMQVDAEKKSAESLPEVCQKCGLCAGECPAKAIELPMYADNEILSQMYGNQQQSSRILL